MMVLKFWGCLLALLLLMALCAAPAAAQEPVCVDDCVAVGEWQVSVGLGLGQRTSPLYDGDDTPLVVMPEVSYYGKRFFLENFEFGFTAFENRRHQFNLLVAPSYDQMYFNRWDPLNFTSGGGLAGASTLSTNTPGYTVTVSREPAGGGPAAGDDMINFDPPESVPGPATDSITVAGAETVTINNQVVDIRSDAVITGNSNNTITITRDGDNLTITGVGDGDTLAISSGASNGAGQALVSGVDLGDFSFNASELTSSGSVIVARDGTLEEVTLGNAQVDWQISKDDVDKRHMAGLAGLEYSYALRHMMFYLQGLTDVTGVHHGQELRSALIFPWARGNHGVALTVGANWQSAEVVNYYYGVTDRESGVPGLQYQIYDSQVTPIVRLDWQQSLNEHWSLRAFGQYMALPDAIKNSPLVTQDQVTGVFIGGVYHF